MNPKDVASSTVPNEKVDASLEKTPLQQTLTPENSNKKLFNKKLLLIAVLFIGIVGIIAVLFGLSQKTAQEKDTKTNSLITPSATLPKDKTGANKNTFNPMVSASNMKRVQNAYVESYKKAGKTYSQPQYEFKYKLSPGLQKSGSFLLVKSAFAANTCNIDTAPDILPGYLLKAHYTLTDAKAVASKYNMDSSVPASIPGDDGVSFQYFFSDPKTSAYFKLSEPSGTYTYHMGAPTNTGTQITQGEARGVSDSTLKDHELDNNLDFVNGAFIYTDPTFQAYLFAYTKKFDLKMVDSESITAIKTTDPVCNVGIAQNMNYINALIGTNSQVGKIINQTRLIEKKYDLKRESLSDALEEYKDNPSLPPVVIGSDATSGNVTIDQAVLVYFDYGNAYAQTAYIPVYLTSGTLSSGTRVFTIFPAISEEELKATPLIPAEKSGGEQLQLETFNPAPPKPSSKLCYGNLVDYSISCTSSGQTICNGFLSLPSDKNDPFDVCSKGCITKSSVFHADAGDDVCSKFMEKQGLFPGGKTDGVKTPGSGFPPAGNFNGGDVSCTLGGCPC